MFRFLLCIILLAGWAGQSASQTQDPSFRETMDWLQAKTQKWYREVINYEDKPFEIFTQELTYNDEGQVVYTIFANEIWRYRYTFYLSDLDVKSIQISPQENRYFMIEVHTIGLSNFVKLESNTDYKITNPWVNHVFLRITSREDGERYANALKHAVKLSQGRRKTKPDDDIF